jgi:hypothetical protein
MRRVIAHGEDCGLCEARRELITQIGVRPLPVWKARVLMIVNGCALGAGAGTYLVLLG